MQGYSIQQGCRIRIEENISETEEGKLKLTRAELLKDAPHPERQGGGEQIPANDDGNVQRSGSEPKPDISLRGTR